MPNNQTCKHKNKNVSRYYNRKYYKSVQLKPANCTVIHLHRKVNSTNCAYSFLARQQRGPGNENSLGVFRKEQNTELGENPGKASQKLTATSQ